MPSRRLTISDSTLVLHHGHRESCEIYLDDSATEVLWIDASSRRNFSHRDLPKGEFEASEEMASGLGFYIRPGQTVEMHGGVCREEIWVCPENGATVDVTVTAFHSTFHEDVLQGGVWRHADMEIVGWHTEKNSHELAPESPGTGIGVVSEEIGDIQFTGNSDLRFASDDTHRVSFDGGDSLNVYTTDGIAPTLSIGANVSTSSDILPTSNDAVNLGGVGMRFATGYFQSIEVEEGVNVSGITGDLELDSLTVTGDMSATNGTFSGHIDVGASATRIGSDLGTDANRFYKGWFDYIDVAADVDCGTINMAGSLYVTGGTPTIFWNGTNNYMWMDPGSATFKADILPNANNNKDIGSSSLRFSTGYFNTLDANSATVANDVSASTLTLSGAASAASATLTGNLGAVDGTFSGNVSGVDGTFTGAVSGDSAAITNGVTAASATLTGNLGAVDGNFSGNISGVGGAFTGAISGDSAAITNGVTAASATLTGNLGAVDGVFSGNVSGVNTTLTGYLTASSASLSGNLGAIDGNFSGNANAVNATLTGGLTAVSANLSGNLDAVDANLTGSLYGVNATLTGNVVAVGSTLSGALAANSAAITNGVTAASATLTGNLGAVDGVFSGNVSGVGGTFSGHISADDGAFAGDVSAASFTTTGDSAANHANQARIGGAVSNGMHDDVQLELYNSDMALLLNRVSTTSRNSMTPHNGMVIYNETTHKFQGYADGAWVDLH